MAKSVDFSWLKLEVPDRRHLTNQPVVLVLAVLKFYPVLKVDQREYIASFQDAIRASFPVFDRAPTLPPIQVQVPGLTLEPTANIPPSWHFRDISREWTITLSQDTLGLETRAYDGFDDFRSRFGNLVDALIEHVVPTLGTRLGLRFLNELRTGVADDQIPKSRSKSTERSDWRRIVRPELLGVAGLPEFQGHVQKSLQQIGLLERDGAAINLNHGIVPEGSIIDPPSAASKDRLHQPFYVLDIDAYQEFGRGREFGVTTTGIIERLDGFHEAISRIFRWSISEDYLQTL